MHFFCTFACLCAMRALQPPTSRTYPYTPNDPSLTHMDRQNSSSSTCAAPHANPPCHAQPPPARARAHLPAQNAHANSLHASHTHTSFMPTPVGTHGAALLRVRAGGVDVRVGEAPCRDGEPAHTMHSEHACADTVLWPYIRYMCMLTTEPLMKWSGTSTVLVA